MSRVATIFLLALVGCAHFQQTSVWELDPSDGARHRPTGLLFPATLGTATRAPLSEPTDPDGTGEVSVGYELDSRSVVLVSMIPLEPGASADPAAFLAGRVSHLRSEMPNARLSAPGTTRFHCGGATTELAFQPVDLPQGHEVLYAASYSTHILFIRDRRETPRSSRLLDLFFKTGWSCPPSA